MKLCDCMLDDFLDAGKIEAMNENVVAVWIDSLFLFSLVWTVGGNVDDEGRRKFDKALRALMVNDPPADLKPYIKAPAQKLTQLFPEGGRLVYDFTFDKTKNKWATWMDTLAEEPLDPEAEYTSIIVPTQDTVRYTYLIDTFLTHNKHLLLVGPTGTGKTAYIKRHLAKGLPMDKYSYLMMNFSAQTSANMTQDIIDGKLDKRKKGVYGPPLGKKMICFVDDLNMPQVETYGAQPPIELLRQFMDHEGWFDRKELTFRRLADVQLVAAMGPPGGGRNNVTNRFLRHFCVVSITPFDNETMTKIFGTLVEWWMKKNAFGPAIQKLKNPMVSCSIDLYDTVQRELLPTPAKSHYTFNLRDVSKVFQGVASAGKNVAEEPPKLTRLWVHEVLRVFSDRLVDAKDADWLQAMLQPLVEKHFKERYHKALGLPEAKPGEGARPILFGNFMVPGQDPRLYDEITDVVRLYQTVVDYLADYNAVSKKPMALVLFQFALEHVCRICRIITQPGGHALLVGVGGSGRQSLTRLAAAIQEYEIFQIEISKTYGRNEWRDDLKKVMRLAGEANKPTVFLFADTQMKEEYFVEDISNLLNTSDVPNLLDSSDLATIMENIRPRAKAAGQDGSRPEMYNFFIAEVRRNLHVVLAFSPVGDAFRDRLRRFPSLVTCTTIDWFAVWPEEALRAVAKDYLAEVAVADALKGPLSDICVSMHVSMRALATRFYDEARRHYYVTPTSYLELITSYKRLLGQKQSEISTMKGRYEVGLEKLASTESQVNTMQAELTDLQPKLIQSTLDTEAAMVVIAAETVDADKVKVVVAAEEASASAEAAKVQVIKDDCEGDLREAMPLLDSAVKALNTLTKNDITEVKGMKSPPQVVKFVMEAICILKGLKPTRIKDPDSGKMVDDYWETSKKMLMEGDFLDSLKTYDKDNISPAIIKQIKPYVDHPDFDPAVVLKSSKAAHGLCCWARAMEAYDRVAKVVGPKKVMLAQAEADLNVVMTALRGKQAELQKVVDKLNALDADLKEKQANKAKLQSDVALCTVKLERATQLISGLGGEKTRWTANAGRLGAQYDALTGDTLLAAAFIAYLGAFTAGYRADAVAAWGDICRKNGIPSSERFSMVTVLGDAVKIRAWNIQGLPKDEFSSENGIIVEYARRWPLCIDPQGQANKWIREMERGRGLLVIKLTDGDYLRTLENAIQFGKAVLLENVPDALDASLEPILLRQTFKQGGTVCIRLGDTTVEYNDDFRFYITTKLRNPHYSPETSVKVSVLNFMITPEGLEDQLLGTVVAKERPDLAEAKNALIIAGAENKKQLKEIEDKILAVLSNSQGNILEDEGAVQILSASKVLSDEISEKQKVADVTEAEIDETRQEYRSVARTSSILFFCTSDTANIDPMYQYSLQWFSQLYQRAIDDAHRSEDLAHRLAAIVDHFTYFLYVNVCRSLFEKDKLLFAFLLASRVRLAEGSMDAGELRFLLTGGVAMDNPHAKPGEWLTDKAWGELCRLSDLPRFAKHGSLRQSVGEAPEAWKKIYDSPQPQAEALPGKWGTALDAFQKLVVLRCLRPDKVVPGMTAYVDAVAGSRFVAPLPFDLAACFADSTAAVPLVFVLSPGSDPMANLLKFAEQKGPMRVEAVSLGQGQGPVAQRWVDEGCTQGFWVVLQNCHLAKSFMPQLEGICEQQIKAASVHKDFRLWLTSYPSEIFPITVLESSVKMTNEAPKGLRAGLQRTYMSDPVSDPAFFGGVAPAREKSWRKMLFGLAFFHSTLQERRKYGPIGFNIPYEFNENDLRISVRQLRMFLEEYDEVPYATLRYTCGECNYGGKVTDGHDRATLMTILNDIYTPAILADGYPLCASGSMRVPPHGEYVSYLNFINSMPLIAAPEVYGFHDNADIAKDIGDTDALLETLSLTQSREGGGGGASMEATIAATAADILAKLPANFDMEAAENKYPTDYFESMNTVLTQELGRVNVLLSVIRSSLVDLQKAVKGLVLMSAELEAVGRAMYDGKVPAAWLKKSFPSLKPLGSFVREVIDRCTFFQSWFDAGPPPCFPLYAFFFTQAFLTASKQNFARKHKVEIDMIDFDFYVVDPLDAAEKPADGVYVSGFFLDGAAWDAAGGVLGESAPKVLFSKAPTLWLKPCETSKFHKFNYYECPLYKTPDRRGILSTTGHSTNFVMDMRLPTDLPASHWVKRGVCMLLSLRD